MRWAAALLLLLAALTLAIPPAAAQGGRPSAASRKRARDHYERAKAFQEAGRFAEAIAAYRQAHREVPDPAFLYNIARCLHLQGERERAVEAYQAYLAERSTGEIADEARAFAAELRAELAAEREAEAARQASARQRAARLSPSRALRQPPAGEPVLLGARAEPAKSTAARAAWIGAGAGLLAAGVLVDTVPDAGHNGTLEATDFIPVGLYLAGLTAVALGLF